MMIRKTYIRISNNGCEQKEIKAQLKQVDSFWLLPQLIVLLGWARGGEECIV